MTNQGELLNYKLYKFYFKFKLILFSCSTVESKLKYFAIILFKEICDFSFSLNILQYCSIHSLVLIRQIYLKFILTKLEENLTLFIFLRELYQSFSWFDGVSILHLYSWVWLYSVDLDWCVLLLGLSFFFDVSIPLSFLVLSLVDSSLLLFYFNIEA